MKEKVCQQPIEPYVSLVLIPSIEMSSDLRRADGTVFGPLLKKISYSSLFLKFNTVTLLVTSCQQKYITPLLIFVSFDKTGIVCVLFLHSTILMIFNVLVFFFLWFLCLSDIPWILNNVFNSGGQINLKNRCTDTDAGIRID